MKEASKSSIQLYHHNSTVTPTNLDPSNTIVRALVHISTWKNRLTFFIRLYQYSTFNGLAIYNTIPMRVFHARNGNEHWSMPRWLHQNVSFIVCTHPVRQMQPLQKSEFYHSHCNSWPSPNSTNFSIVLLNLSLLNGGFVGCFVQ